MTQETETFPINVQKIMQMIPHRYPILLVDRLLEVVPFEKAVGLKNVTFNEPHFNGHFPDHPVMPGVLIVEALAQTSALMVVNSYGKEAEGKLVYFMSIENAKFRKPVVPGDSMELHITTLKHRGKVWKFEGKAMVNGELCAEATFSAMIAPNE